MLQDMAQTTELWVRVIYAEQELIYTIHTSTYICGPNGTVKEKNRAYLTSLSIISMNGANLL